MPRQEVNTIALAPRRIKGRPGSELARLLEEAARAPVILEKDGEFYRLDRTEEARDIWAGYDPERVLEGLERSAGALAGVDPDALLAEIHAEREQDSQGRPA